MIEMLVYGIFFLLTNTIGYLTLKALYKKHKEKYSVVFKNPVCPYCGSFETIEDEEFYNYNYCNNVWENEEYG